MDNFSDQEFFVVSTTNNPFSSPLDVDLSKGFTHVTITSACIPKTYYVLPHMATLTINQYGETYLAYFEAGNYSVNSFPGIFASKTAAAGVSPITYTATFPSSATDVQSSKFKYEAKFTEGELPIFTITDKYLGRMMGFPLNQAFQFSTLTVNSSSLVSADVVNFQSYDELLIISDMVKNKRNLLQEIYSAANQYNSSIVWTNASLPLNAKRLNPTTFNNYRFALTTEEGDLIDLNGSEWSFVLMFFKASDFESVVKKFIAVNMLENENKKLQ